MRPRSERERSSNRTQWLLSTALGTGQRLYLTIDANQQNYYCDSTLVTWTVRSGTAP